MKWLVTGIGFILMAGAVMLMTGAIPPATEINNSKQVVSSVDENESAVQEDKTATPVEESGLDAMPAKLPAEEMDITSEEHEELLEALESDEFAKYEEGKINFNLLRQTKLYKDPPPVFPEALKKLDQTTVQMVGFMAPYDDLADMSTFMLMPISVGCFFCVPPSAQEVVLVRQNAEGEPPFLSAPILVEGTLKIWQAQSPDQAHEMFLYVIENADVQEYEEENAG